MAKLTDIRIHACVGDDNPRLQRNGERCYFPHVHIGGPNTCENPRFYQSTGTRDLEPVRGSYMTINEVGAHNHNGQVPFDAFAQLVAAAPKLLYLLDRVTDAQYFEDQAFNIREARRLVTKLLALDIPDANEDGWGPYYNADGTPWKDKDDHGKR